MPQLAELGRAYLAARARLPTDSPAPLLFQLPGEAHVTSARMSHWVTSTLTEAGIIAPPGFAYLGHSLRSGGSSAAEAILVPHFRGNWLGGWSQSSSTRELHYIDPSILPTPAAHALFGWLLAGAYHSDTPVWVRSPHTQATVDPGE